MSISGGGSDRKSESAATGVLNERFEASLTMLASDALAFTRPLTLLRRKVIVDALREAARGGVTEEREAFWLDRMLSVGCTVTAPFREDGWVNDGFGI